MSRFIVTALTLILLAHVYVGLRLLPDMPIGALGTTVGIVLLTLSCVLMPAGLMARRMRRQPWADRLAWIGLITTGLFSSVFVLTLLRDLILLPAVFLASPEGLANFSRDSALAVPVLAVIVTLIGFINARRVARVVDVEVPIPDLPDALDNFTIAQISDIHVGPTIKRGYLQAIVDRVNRVEADVIAITGDLVDGHVSHLAPHVEPLAELSARHGTYFVTGNHEYYSGVHSWVAELERLGIHVLLNEHVVVEHQGSSLLIAGVTDYSAHTIEPSHRSDPEAAMAGAPESVAVRLLLAHQPRSGMAAAEAGFDLQLSGHTHGGQFLPWNLFVRFQQPFTAGLRRIDQLWVYTSRGTGYWGPPKRLGAPSEITRIRLVKATSH